MLIKKTKILPFSLVIFLSSILLIGIISSSSYAYAQQPQQSSNQRLPPSIIAASTSDTTPHALNLKATQQGEDGQPKKISGFKIDLTNVVTAQINSQVLVFATDSSLQITGAKIRTVSGQLIDLIPSTTTQANAFSIAGLPLGVYTLDIITQKGNTKAAYEGVLVISQLPTTVINENTKQVINQEINQNTRVDTDFKVVFRERDRDNDDGNDKDGKKTNWRENPDCWYHGKFVCDDEGKCDSDKFDCWSDCEDGSTATTGMCPGDDDPKCIDDGRYVCKEVEDEDEDEAKENLIDYEDGCPPGSANPEEGCTLEGYQCGPDGCGYYSHGVCETCTNEVSSQVDPCDENPQSAECQPEDPCIENPDAEGCQELPQPIDFCEENPSLPECQQEDTGAAFVDEERIAEGDDGEGGDEEEGEGGDEEEGEGGDEEEGEGGDEEEGEGGDN